jgi:hypothetical protein
MFYSKNIFKNIDFGDDLKEMTTNIDLMITHIDLTDGYKYCKPISSNISMPIQNVFIPHLCVGTQHMAEWFMGNARHIGPGKICE